MTHETREGNDGWLRRAAARCYGRIVLPTDTHEETVFKRTMLIFWGIIFCLNVPQLFREYESFWYTFAEFLLFVMTCSSVLYCFITRTMPRALAESYIVVCCLFVLIPLDLNSMRQLDERNWPLIIVCLDVALVLDMRRRVPYLVLAGLIPYLWLVSLNSTYNFGFTRDLTASWKMPVVCDCARPPCEYPFMKSFWGGLSHVAALVLDFYFTRRFATLAKKEKRVMQSSIDTAGDLAVRLSRLDLKGAQDVLDACLAGEDAAGVAMPAELRAAFADILSNLRVYKPYLPLSCLPEHAREGTHVGEMEVSQSSRHSSANSKCESVSRNSSHNSFPHAAATGAVHQQQKPRWKRATLMQTNMHRTLRGEVVRESEASVYMGQEQVASGFAASLTALLTRLLVLVSAQGGVVDLFIGDRVWSSFNTSRLLAKHAHGAVRACTALLGSDGSYSLNVGLACGRVLCGDLGCDTMRRYTVLGHVPLLTCALERIGRGLNVAMLCNEQLMRDIRDEHDVRLVPRTVHFVKLGREETDFGGQLMSSKYVYELLPRSSGEAIETASPRQGAEWMYELVDNASHAWDTHDACVRAFLAGASIEQALQGCSDDDAEVIRVQLTSACASRSPFKYKF